MFRLSFSKKRMCLSPDSLADFEKEVVNLLLKNVCVFNYVFVNGGVEIL